MSSKGLQISKTRYSVRSLPKLWVHRSRENAECGGPEFRGSFFFRHNAQPSAFSAFDLGPNPNHQHAADYRPLTTIIFPMPVSPSPPRPDRMRSNRSPPLASGAVKSFKSKSDNATGQRRVLSFAELIAEGKRRRHGLSRRGSKEDAGESVDATGSNEKAVEANDEEVGMGDEEVGASNEKAVEANDEEVGVGNEETDGQVDASGDVEVGGSESEVVAASAKEDEGRAGVSNTRKDVEIVMDDGTLVVRVREYVPFTFPSGYHLLIAPQPMREL